MKTGQWGTYEGFDEFFSPKKDTPYLAWLLPTGVGTWLRYELSLINTKVAVFSVGTVRDGTNGVWVDDGEQQGSFVTHVGAPVPHGPAASPEFFAAAVAMVPRMIARLSGLLATGS